MEEPDINPGHIFYEFEAPKPAPPDPKKLEKLYDEVKDAILDCNRRAQKKSAEVGNFQPALVRTKARIVEINLSLTRYQTLLQNLRECEDWSSNAESFLGEARTALRTHQHQPPTSHPVTPSGNLLHENENSDDIENLADARAAVAEILIELRAEKANMEREKEKAERDANRFSIEQEVADAMFTAKIEGTIGGLIDEAMPAVPQEKKHLYRTFQELLSESNGLSGILEEIRSTTSTILGFRENFAVGA